MPPFRALEYETHTKLTTTPFSIVLHLQVKIVSVGQERMDELDPEKTVFETISEGLDEIQLGTESVLSRAYLSWFGFKGQSQQSKVRSSFYFATGS